MKIRLIAVGKTDGKYIIEAIETYTNRLKHYTNFDIQIIPEIKNAKNLSEVELKQKEGQLILASIQASDDLVLLDAEGTSHSSESFASFIEKKSLASTRTLVFVIGGAFGFSPSVYQRASSQLSLSSMTFTHQMVRLFFVEQLYRAFTIIKGESYHHK